MTLGSHLDLSQFEKFFVIADVDFGLAQSEDLLDIFLLSIGCYRSIYKTSLISFHAFIFWSHWVNVELFTANVTNLSILVSFCWRLTKKLCKSLTWLKCLIFCLVEVSMRSTIFITLFIWKNSFGISTVSAHYWYFRKWIFQSFAECNILCHVILFEISHKCRFITVFFYFKFFSYEKLFIWKLLIMLKNFWELLRLLINIF
jgi:hypothetical protein